jgi:hypothetical protein
MLACNLNFGLDDNDTTWFRLFQGKLLDWGLFDRWTSSPRQGCEADIDFPQQLTIERGGLAVAHGLYLSLPAFPQPPKCLIDLPRLPHLRFLQYFRPD